MSAIENEIIELTGFEPRRKYKDRQDYLGALLYAANDLDDEVFESLSEEATEWVNAAATAIKKKKSIVDFPDIETTDEDDSDADDADESDDTDDADDDSEDADESDDAADDSEDADDDAEEAPPVKKRGRPPGKNTPKKVDKATKPKQAAKAKTIADDEPDETDDESDETDDDHEEVEKPKAKRGRRPKGSETKPKKDLKVPRLGLPKTEADLRLDKFGLVIGSKNSAAAAMFEQGCSMAQVKGEIGGTYYNLLTKLAKAGHKLLKDEGSTEVKLIHKDEYGAKVKGKGK